MSEQQNQEKENLDRAITDINSDLYMQKNPSKIKKYLWLKGIDIPIENIKSYLLSLKSAPVVLNRNNERIMSEVSRPFVSKPSFFSDIQGDTLVLSKHRLYGTKKHLILVICDYLSNFTYLEAMSSTSFSSVSDAFKRIFIRSPYLPENCERLTFDRGVEITSLNMQSWLKSLGIELNLVFPRGPRGSKGAALAEVKIRRTRLYLESMYLERNSAKKLHEILPIVERRLNNESLSCLDGLSASEALRHQSRFIAMVKHSVKFRRRKYLKLEMHKKRNLALYSVVRIRKNSKKIIFKKEAYGSLSKNLFIVISSVKNDFISSYKLGNIFDLTEAFDCTFTFHELVPVPISYGYAVYHEVLNNPGTIIERSNDAVVFKPEMSKRTYIGPIKMFN